jgi:HTH-type transcriptional regulator/antitoxin HigA
MAVTKTSVTNSNWKTAPFRPDWASAPGDTIMDIMENRAISKSLLGEALGLSLGRLENLLIGGTMSSELASKLSKVLGGSETFWNNREKQYRQALVRIRKSAEVTQMLGQKP